MSFHSILCVTGGDTAEKGSPISRAVSLAEANQARLTLVDVVSPIGPGLRLPAGAPTADELTAAIVERRQRALEQMAEPVRDRVDVRVQVLTGTMFLEVIRAVLRSGHDLVIKPAEDPAWIARLFGSQDMHLLRKCPCPVWLTGPKDRSHYRSIVAAVDFDPLHAESDTSALNRQILELATSLAFSDGASLHVVHAWDAPEAQFAGLFADNPKAAALSITQGEFARRQQAMDRLSTDIIDTLGRDAFGYLKPHYNLVQGPARTAIPALVRRIEADLVVMGTIARTGIPGFLIGNTAEAILDQLACAVLAVKPAGFVSPVSAETD